MPIHNPPEADGATKEFFLPALCGDSEAQFEFWGDFQVINSISYHSFKVPHDFTALVSAEAICVNGDNEELDVGGTSDYGAVGEAYNTHSEADAALTTSFTANRITAVDISGILTALSANDYVGVRMSELNVRWIGIRFRYS